MSQHRIEGDFILLYGIELEVLLAAKNPHSVSTDEDVGRSLSRSLEAHHIGNEILDDSKVSDYQKWIITHDGSIGRYKLENKWGVELVSSIFMPTRWWSRTCSVVWRAITSGFDVLESPKCGTHVHISLYRDKG